VARVLLLTPPDQSADVAFLLEEEGHEPLFWPLLGAPLPQAPGLRAAAEQLGRFNWVVVTNRPVLRAFFEAVSSAGSRSALQRVRWLAGDAPTARAIERHGGEVRVPGDGKWTSAVSGLMESGDDVLVLHSEPLPEILEEALEAAGVHVTSLQVEVPAEPQLDTPDDARVVIVHSAAAGEAWAEAVLGEARHVHDQYCCGPHGHLHHSEGPSLAVSSELRVVATSASAASALQELGVKVHCTASATAADAVVDAALSALSE
jgi:uroporphyrinogen-III synthase